jgi:flagellar hook-length control protein FliK
VLETVNAPAFTPGWQDETVNKLAQIVVTRNERAELKLNPAELGPVSIRVEMHAGDQASILIVAASPETRSALEQSLPQLRDLLSAQGITLGQASVQDGNAQRDPTPSPGQPGERADTETTPAPRDNVVHLAARRADHLVDLFA